MPLKFGYQYQLERHKDLLKGFESRKNPDQTTLDHIKRKRRSIEWLESYAEVHFSIGSPPNVYTLKTGTRAECEDYWDNLHSETDPGWRDASKGTNPYREACEVVST